MVFQVGDIVRSGGLSFINDPQAVGVVVSPYATTDGMGCRILFRNGQSCAYAKPDIATARIRALRVTDPGYAFGYTFTRTIELSDDHRAGKFAHVWKAASTAIDPLFRRICFDLPRHALLDDVMASMTTAIHGADKRAEIMVLKKMPRPRQRERVTVNVLSEMPNEAIRRLTRPLANVRALTVSLDAVEPF